jgi:arylsulfatase A-like enzyme
MCTVLPAQAAEKKPNILFIMGDDIGWMQVGVYQNGMGFGNSKYRGSRSPGQVCDTAIL